MATKLRELKNIRTKNAMIQHAYDKSNFHTQYDITLHIVDRVGDVEEKDFFSRKQVIRTKEITKCNRVAEHWDTGNWSKINSVGAGNSGYKLCSKCGTREDFEKVMTDLDEWNKTRREEYNKQEQEKEAQRNEKWERVKVATRLNGHDLMAIGLSLQTTEYENELIYTKEINGKKYQFKITTLEI